MSALEAFIEGGAEKSVWLAWIFGALMVVFLSLLLAMYFGKIKPKDGFSNKEGLQYLGASFPVRDDTGFPNGDKLAVAELQKNNFTERLVEAGREPNLYEVQTDNAVTTAPAAVGAATGFRDRMANEEELAQYLGK